MYNFQFIWLWLAIPDQAQLICGFLQNIILIPLLILEVLEFQVDWSRAFLAITQDIEFSQTWNWEWEVKHRNNSNNK